MSSNTDFNLTNFTKNTKKVCLCSFASIAIIILFVITPLSNFSKTSAFMKVIGLIVLFYTIYLNNTQTNHLKNANADNKSPQIKSQLQMNIICSYIFTLFLALLVFFVIKSFF